MEGQRQLEAQLGASIEFNSERISGLEKAKEVTENNVKDLHVRVFALQEQLDRQQADINKQERFSRRNHFRVVGVKETEGESCFDIIKNILVDKFGWDGAPQIERAHRDGLRKNGRSAHILVKMLSYQDTVRVLKARRTAMEGSPLCDGRLAPVRP